MPESMHSFNYSGESITFGVIYSRRRSLGITVSPGRGVLVRAPQGADWAVVEQFVHQHARWIHRQLRYFAQFEPRAVRRRYVGGESHLYLGRQYRLKIMAADKVRDGNAANGGVVGGNAMNGTVWDSNATAGGANGGADIAAAGGTGRAAAAGKSHGGGVVLADGFFYISAVDVAAAHVEKLLDGWYRRRAAVYFADAVEACWQRYRFADIASAKPALKIRRMKTRWGSLSTRGSMTLNLELIKAPPECIDYVVVHELCHLLHHNHGKGFYGLLESKMPDWKQRKFRLEKTLA